MLIYPTLALLLYVQQKNIRHPVPDYRMPTRREIENIMPASRRRQHYAQNAFASLNVFAEKNPERVFL